MKDEEKLKPNQKKNNKSNIAYKNDKEILLSRYFIKKYFCNMEDIVLILREDLDKIKKDEQIPSKLKDLKCIEISFAMKLSNDGKSIIPLEKKERIVSSYLPTKVNYNFPFLINSNLILDKGRGLLKDHIFNKCLISVLPKYISIFQKDIRESFFNQYALTLVQDCSIDNKTFEKIFFKNLKKEKRFLKKYIPLYTRKSEDYIKRDLHECFCEDLFLENDQPKKPINNKNLSDFIKNKKGIFNCLNQNKIIDFFSDFMEDSEDLENLKDYLKKFFKKKLGIIYEEENRISDKDFSNVRTLVQYYETSINCINFDDFINFLDSEFYRNIFSPSFLLGLLDKLKKTKFLERLAKANIVKNNFGQFIKPENTFFYENKKDLSYLENPNNNNIGLCGVKVTKE